MQKAVLLVGHGSKLQGSDSALNLVLDSLRKKDPSTFFLSAFLDIQTPRIPEGIELCLKQGAEEVIVVPYFVQAGKHVVQDIPQIILEAKTRYPEKSIFVAEYLDFDPKIVSVVEERIAQAREQKKFLVR